MRGRKPYWEFVWFVVVGESQKENLLLFCRNHMNEGDSFLCFSSLSVYLFLDQSLFVYPLRALPCTFLCLIL